MARLIGVPTAVHVCQIEPADGAQSAAGCEEVADRGRTPHLDAEGVVFPQEMADVFGPRDALLDKMTDGVLVLDRDGRVMIANDAARALQLDGPWLAGALGLSSLGDAPEQWRAEAQIGSEPARQWLDVRIDPIRDRWGALAGRLVVARDVTLQKALEDEREHLIDELKGALKKVIQLEGLLPICASCRKVRDDGGYWGDVEEYFGSRAPVEFTHAICPECERKLYPMLAE